MSEITELFEKPFIELTESEKVIHLVLPYPPSLNTYYRHVGSRVLISKKGREYRCSIKSLATLNRWKSFGKQRVSVSMIMHPPDRRRRDCDNTFKCVLDSLEHAGLYDNDSQIDALSIRRAEVVNDGVMHVTIEVIA